MRQWTAIALFILADTSSSTNTTKRSLISEYQIFVQVQGSDGQQPPFSIELSSDKNLVDLVCIVRSLRAIPERVLLHDLVVNVNGKEFKNHGAGGLGTPLADAGVTAESVVNIGWSPLAVLTDIELLFHLFDNPTHTKAALNYSTYSEFQTAYPDVQSQKQRLEGNFGLYQLYLMAHFVQEDRIRFISCSLWALRGIAETTINFDVVQRLSKLDHLTIVDANCTGLVHFGELPRQLTHLDLARNQLTGIQNPEECPPSLRRLMLDSNKFGEDISQDLFPNALLFDLFVA